MARNIAWGIDIGESAIKAVQLRRSGQAVTVHEHLTIPCEARLEDAQGSDKEFRVRNALQDLLSQVDLRRGAVAVSISGQDVFPRFIPLPPVEKKRVPEIVRYEARTQMPFPIEEVIWDYQPLDENPEPGEEVEVALFAIKRATVYSFLANLRLAPLVPDLIEISPLAIYNFLHYDHDFDTGTVVIDIGAGNTDLVIIDGERFWTRNVSISGNDITRALQEKYQISFEEAEALKHKAAGSKQADKLFGVMRPIVDDLLGEVQRSIGYYKAQTHNVRIGRVILLGNAFKLSGLVSYFRESLDYEVGLLDSLERIQLAPSVGAEAFTAELPNYGVAVGLALQGLGVARVKIDMLPPDVRITRALKRKIPFAAAAVFLLAFPILLGFQGVQRDLARYKDQADPLERKIQEHQRLVDEETREKNLEPMPTQLKQIARIGEERLAWARYISSLHEALNEIFKQERFPRERVLLRGYRYVPKPVRPAEGRDRAAKKASKAKPPEADERTVKIIVEFESKDRYTQSDADLLLSLLRGRPYVQDAKLDEVREETRGLAGETVKAKGGVEIREVAGKAYVASIEVTFSAAPPKDSPAARAPKAGGKT